MIWYGKDFWRMMQYHACGIVYSISIFSTLGICVWANIESVVKWKPSKQPVFASSDQSCPPVSESLTKPMAILSPEGFSLGDTDYAFPYHLIDKCWQGKTSKHMLMKHAQKFGSMSQYHPAACRFFWSVNEWTRLEKGARFPKILEHDRSQSFPGGCTPPEGCGRGGRLGWKFSVLRQNRLGGDIGGREHSTLYLFHFVFKSFISTHLTIQ